MELIWDNCMRAYYPGRNLAYDEVSILMTGRTEYRKLTKHKKVHKSIQFWALAESTQGRQYLWWFDLDRNDGEVGKIHKAVIRGVKELEVGVGHVIYMENLFVTPKLLN